MVLLEERLHHGGPIVTILQLVRETHISIGEPSDLQYYVADRDTPDQDPVENTDYYRAWCQYIDALNDAQSDIATWKFSDGRQLRFRSLEDYTSFDSQVSSFTIDSITGNIVAWTDATATTTTDFYKGRMIYQAATNTYALVMRSYTSGATNYFVVAAAGSLAAGAATIAKREYTFINTDFTTVPVTMNGIPWDYDNGRPLEIINVIDSAASTELEVLGNLTHQLDMSPTVGTPASVYKTPAVGFRFDTWPDASKSYLVQFYRSPRRVQYIDALTTEPELPEHFHRAIWLWMTWWGLRREELSSDCYSAKKDLEDFLKRKRTEEDFGDSKQLGQVKVFPGGK